MALLAARMAGWLVRDVVLTRDEIDGLMAGHLVSADPPTASTPFTEWLEAEGSTLGPALRLGTGPPLPPPVRSHGHVPSSGVRVRHPVDAV